MAPVTKRRKAKQDEIPESIFDALNLHPPGGGDAEVKAREPKADEPTVSDLLKQMQGLQERVDAAERANVALTTAAPIVETAPKAPVFSLDGLPDPLEDSKGYAAQLAERQAKYARETQEYYSAQQNASNKQSNSVNALWQDFTSQYGEYAKDQEGMEFAALKVKNALSRRGIDVTKYMNANSDRFFRDVVKAYDDRFGKPGGDDAGDDEVDDTPTPPRRQRKAKSQVTEEDEDQDDGRSTSVFGGLDGSGGGRKPAAPPAGDLVKDLQDIQRKSGYF